MHIENQGIQLYQQTYMCIHIRAYIELRTSRGNIIMPISFINTIIYKAYSNENIRKIHKILVVRNTLYV